MAESVVDAVLIDGDGLLIGDVADAGIVEEDVEATEGVEGLLKTFLDGRLVRDIEV